MIEYSFLTLILFAKFKAIFNFFKDPSSCGYIKNKPKQIIETFCTNFLFASIKFALIACEIMNTLFEKILYRNPFLLFYIYI